MKPLPICTRCGRPIKPWQSAVPTVDGERHVDCPGPPVWEQASAPVADPVTPLPEAVHQVACGTCALRKLLLDLQQAKGGR